MRAMLGSRTEAPGGRTSSGTTLAPRLGLGGLGRTPRLTPTAPALAIPPDSWWPDTAGTPADPGPSHGGPYSGAAGGRAAGQHGLETFLLLLPALDLDDVVGVALGSKVFIRGQELVHQFEIQALRLNPHPCFVCALRAYMDISLGRPRYDRL